MTGGGGVPGETLVQRRSEALREGKPHPRFMALTCLGGKQVGQRQRGDDGGRPRGSGDHSLGLKLGQGHRGSARLRLRGSRHRCPHCPPCQGPCRREMEDALNHLKFLDMLSPRGVHIPNCDKRGFYKRKQVRVPRPGPYTASRGGRTIKVGHAGDVASEDDDDVMAT